jgi:sec-independent protein translocase protein TatA
MRIGPFGIWEILIILIVVLLIFGPRRLPEMAKGLGQSVRLFRKEMRDFKADLEMDERRPAAPAPAPAAAHAAVPPVAQSAPAAPETTPAGPAPAETSEPTAR